MKILSIDTATPRLFLCLSEGDAVVAAKEIVGAETHMKQLMPAIDHLLSETGVAPADIDYFAASVGPGSFTGIRIGVATAQAMALGRDKQCMALNSLAACAYGKTASGRLLLPMFEARNRRVYAMAYYGSEILLETQVEQVYTFMEKVADQLRARKLSVGELVLCGDEAAVSYVEDAKVRAALEHACPGAEIRSSGDLYYNPGVLAALACAELENGRILNYADLLPNYYAATQAERTFGVYADANENP